MFVQLFFKYLTFEKAWSALYIKAKEEMVRYLAEPRNIILCLSCSLDRIRILNIYFS
jgi:hypothetical protein